jgi:hypothetical protein
MWVGNKPTINYVAAFWWNKPYLVEKKHPNLQVQRLEPFFHGTISGSWSSGPEL